MDIPILSVISDLSFNHKEYTILLISYIEPDCEPVVVSCAHTEFNVDTRAINDTVERNIEVPLNFINFK